MCWHLEIYLQYHHRYTFGYLDCAVRYQAERYKSGAFQFREGEYAVYGEVIAGGLTLFVFAKVKKLPFFSMAGSVWLSLAETQESKARKDFLSEPLADL